MFIFLQAVAELKNGRESGGCVVGEDHEEPRNN